MNKRDFRKELIKIGRDNILLRGKEYYLAQSRHNTIKHTARVNSQTLKAQIMEAMREHDSLKNWNELMGKYLEEALGIDTNSNEDDLTPKTEKEVKKDE